MKINQLNRKIRDTKEALAVHKSQVLEMEEKLEKLREEKINMVKELIK